MSHLPSPAITKSSVETTETTDTNFNEKIDDDHVNDNEIVKTMLVIRQKPASSSPVDAGEKQKGVPNPFGCSQCEFR